MSRPWALAEGQVWRCFALALAAWAAIAACNRRAPLGEDRSTEPAGYLNFVLQPDFQGPFFVIYGAAGGTPPQWRGDTAVYQVPPGGVLEITQPFPRSRRTYRAFVLQNQTVRLPEYLSCADMRLDLAAKPGVVGVCRDYELIATGVPEHFFVVVSDWLGIPTHYNRAGFLYDSLGLWLGGVAESHKWEEPRPASDRRPQTWNQ